MRNKSLIIICVTIILCVLIVAVTAVILTTNNQNTSQQEIIENNSTSSESTSSESTGSSEATTTSQKSSAFSIKSATFYSDGNPNTGEKVTINVGSEHAGETIDVMTFYYRDNSKLNWPSSYTTLTVNSDGEVSLTDTTAMPKYPDKCHIDIMYHGQTYTADAYIGTYKGTQTVNF